MGSYDERCGEVRPYDERVVRWDVMMRDGLCRDVVMRGTARWDYCINMRDVGCCGLLWDAVMRGGVRWYVTKFESCSRVV
jgi:hypothetical protein